jgi:hypothetical protein
LSCLHADLRAFADDNSDVHDIHLKTDGAGCYSGKYTALALPWLSEWTGLKILSHSLGEAGQNKSELDGHFGVSGPKAAAVVASGGGNASVASELAGVLGGGAAGGIVNTTSREVIISRCEQKKQKSTALSKVGIRQMAHRVMEFDQDGEWTGVRFYKHAGFGLGMFIEREKMTAMWEGNEPQGPPVGRCRLTVSKPELKARLGFSA